MCHTFSSATTERTTCTSLRAVCYKRQPVLGAASRRDLFPTVLEQARKRYRLVVIRYVVMPEHFDLLISEPKRENPSTVMQALKFGFARRMLAELAGSQVSKKNVKLGQRRLRPGRGS